MRYIPDLAENTIVQVPEDRNSYVNILSFGASGKGNIQFSGRITDIQEEVITISDVSDDQGSTLSQYLDTLKSSTDLTVFGYSPVSTAEDPILSVSSHTTVGVNFSSSPATNSNLAPLTYYVFGFDPITGRLPNYRSTVQVGSKVLNPDLWNTEQYVQLSFNRISQYAIPIIYRVWGTRIDFLGVIGSNKIGYPGSGSFVFRDLGITEIPSWSDDPSLPWFLQGVFSTVGLEVTQSLRMTRKIKATIQPNTFGIQTSFIQVKSDENVTGLFSGNTVKFVIDDTKYLQNAINLCASSNLKEVFFPAGIYNITDTFYLTNQQTDYSNITLRGVGSASVIKRLPCTLGNPQYPGLINFSGLSQSVRVNGIKIRSLNVNGNSSETFSSLSPITNEVGIRISNGNGIVINDCSVTECGGGGIEISDTNGLSLTSNIIRFSGRSYEQPVSPLIVNISENIVAQGNLMEFATTGPKIISTEFSTINGNIIRSCGDRGIQIQTSSQWNAQGNLAYSDNDSIIRSIDTYNNEYSRATIEVRKGFALDPVYMTVTLGGESVEIIKNSISAEIFALNSSGVKTTPSIGSFRVLETSAQLEAGIFSLTLPGMNSESGSGTTPPIPSTNSLTNSNGYMYEVKADVILGNNGRGYQPLSIRSVAGTTPYIAIEMRNPSDLLSFMIYSESNPENDKIRISGFENTGQLDQWNQNLGYTVLNIDTDTNSLLLSPITGLQLTTTPLEFTGSPVLFIIRQNYFVADGNLLVHSF